MNALTNAYATLHHRITQAAENAPLHGSPVTLIAVSKHQSASRIDAALALEQRHFGENLVQEAQAHWHHRRALHSDITLHLIGPLQSNKAKQAVALFDVIHSIDREKIAQIVKNACDEAAKPIACLVQVNIGQEPQKAGIAPKELTDFLGFCQHEVSLPIVGLMAIPPVGENPAPYFALMKKLQMQHNLAHLSVGMSDDFETAIRFGATHIRLGTAFFGERNA